MRSPYRRSKITPSAKSDFGWWQSAGLTLVEVMISVMILAMVTLGVLSTLLSTRQMTDFARKQMLVDTAIQGILEQLKNRTSTELLPNLPNNPTPPYLVSMSAMNTYLGSGGTAWKVAVDLDNDPSNPLNQLIVSPGTPIAIPAGAVPADADSNGFGDVTGDGVDDVGVNLLKLDVRNTNGLNGSTSVSSDDINIYIMIWITDVSQRTTPLEQLSRQITIYYTWTYKEASITRKIVDSVRAVCTPL